MLLMTSVLPNIVASKAFAGREAVVRAMDLYFGCAAHKAGSSLVKRRFATLQGQIDDADLGRFECVNGIAILANTVPTAFWTIFHIFSAPTILAEVRKQVEMITISAMTPKGPVRSIDLRRLKDAPILFSALQEALRLRATGIGPRSVMADMSIGEEQYLLKKDSVIIIANKALHMDVETWGEAAGTFQADRFNGKTPAQSFRGFGGGVNLCPGRGFAMAEVAGFVAMLAMRYDLEPAGGKWDEPGQDLNNMSLQIAPPRKKVMVSVVKRKYLEDVSWSFKV